MSTLATRPPAPERFADDRIRLDPPRVKAEPPGRLALAWGRLPVWLQIVVVWALSRVVTTAILLAFAANQEETWQTPLHPDLITFSNIWDGEWYRWIGAHAYPSELPLDSSGHVTANARAFMPIFPMIVRALTLLTGASFELMAVVVSTAFGLASAFMLHRLLTLVVDRGTAMFAVVLYCVMPLSPLLQVGYAESMQMFFVSLLLYLLVKREWLVMAPVIVIASLVRPTGLAWACTLGLYCLARWWRAWRGTEAFGRTEQLRVVGVGLLSLAMGFAWPAIAWLVTGELHAYVDTELSWRAQYTGPTELTPFTPWFVAAAWWFGFWKLGATAGYVAGALVVGVLAAVFIVPQPRVFRRLGLEVRLWLASYLLYILAVFFPQSSVFRMLMPLFPALGALALPRSPIYRVALVLASVAGQVLWVWGMWFVIGRDWSPA